MVAVMILNVWLFSIPPDLRRQEICLERRTSTLDCSTLGEWIGQVEEYYQNGGGINFDFSIEGK